MALNEDHAGLDVSIKNDMRDQHTEHRLAAIVCGHVANGSLPILRAVRDEPEMDEDSGWQFICDRATEEDPDEAKVWLLGEILEIDPSLREYMDLPSGTVLTQSNNQESWHVSQKSEAGPL